jgi:hypothetical protein
MVIHPPLLVAAYVLQPALSNDVSFAGLARPLGIGIAASVIVIGLGWLAARSAPVGGLLAAAIILSLQSQGLLLEIWRFLSVNFGAGAAVAAIAAVGGSFVALVIWLVLVGRRGWARFAWPATRVLNLASGLVLLWLVIAYGLDPGVNQTPSTSGNLTNGPHAKAEAALPDIYLVLLDGYPRADSLLRIFGFDNSEFIGHLEAAGYSADPASRSNYVYTQLSLASMFHMKYLAEIDTLGPLIGQSGTFPAEFREALNSAPIFGLLHDHGYEVVVIPNDYEHVALRDAADRFLAGGQLTDFERELLQKTWILDIVGLAIPNLFFAQQADRVETSLKDLSALVGEPQDHPKFVFAHLPVPHLPIVVDGEGRAVEMDSRRFGADSPAHFGISEEAFIDAYRAQLTYVNRQVLEIVDELGRPGARERVVVFMSDHGYSFDLSDVEARFANLFAALTPRASGLFGNGMTPVNIFPRLFNRYLDTSLPTVRDRYFASPGSREPMLLTEVGSPGT